MSEAKARSERIRSKIAASQARQRRESATLPPAPTRNPLPDAYPPESYRSLAAEYPWLVVATGAGLGLLAGALVPKRFGSKLGDRLMTAAALAAELGMAMGKQANAPTQPVAADSPEHAAGTVESLKERVTRSGGSARSSGLVLAGEAIRLVARMRGKYPGANPQK